MFNFFFFLKLFTVSSYSNRILLFYFFIQDEQVLSEEYSSLVNKAYATLLNPLDRGLYLLNLEGISIEEEAVTMDAEMLMYIMEKNEEVEEADSEQAFSELRDGIQKDMDRLIK